VDPAKGHVPLQFMLLGLIFVGMATITDSSYALLSSSVASRLKGNVGLMRGQRYLAGLVYVGLGVTTALSGSNKNECGIRRQERGRQKGLGHYILVA
jgi:threonine/homoserine/homoserine lactone efflux protein